MPPQNSSIYLFLLKILGVAPERICPVITAGLVRCFPLFSYPAERKTATEQGQAAGKLP
jgi:hypothetical protein